MCEMQKMVLSALGWFGTIVSVIGSFAVAFGFMFYGYCFFVTGATAWAIVARAKRDNALLVLQGFFFCANIVGLIRNY
jgi:hypothetical protein